MKHDLLNTVLLSMICTCLAAGPAFTAEINGGTDCDRPGAPVTIPVTFAQDPLNESVTGLQFDVLYDPLVLTPGPAAPVGGGALADHLVVWNGTAPLTPGVLRVVVYSPTNLTLSNGTLLDLPFTLSAAAGGASIPLALPLHDPASYTGPGAILTNVSAVKSVPDPSPAAGSVAVVVITDPVDQQTCIGGSASFNCSSDIGGATTYQWSRNGMPIPGATAPGYTIPVVEPTDAGIFSCDIINVCGSFTSSPAVMWVDEYPCPPSNLRVYDPGTGGHLLADWTPNPSAWVDDYTLYWGSTASGPYPAYSPLGVVAGADLGGLSDGARYFCRVSASVQGVEGPFSNESNAVPTGGGMDLPQVADYGYQTTPSNDTGHADAVTYRFPPRSGDVTVWFDLYDVDTTGEVVVRSSGEEIMQPATTINSSWSGLQTVTLPDPDVKDTETNILTFEHPIGAADATWGVRRASIRLPAPAISAVPLSQTIDLTIQQLPSEPTLASYDIFRSDFSGYVPSIANRIATGVTGAWYRDDVGLVNGQDYFYIVRPIDSIANRGFDTAQVTAQPTSSIVTPAANLRVTTSGTDDIALSWDPVVTEGGVQEYRIYEGPGPGTLVYSGDAVGATNFLRAGDLSDGQNHFYRIYVVDNHGQISVNQQELVRIPAVWGLSSEAKVGATNKGDQR